MHRANFSSVKGLAFRPTLSCRNKMDRRVSLTRNAIASTGLRITLRELRHPDRKSFQHGIAKLSTGEMARFIICKRQPEHLLAQRQPRPKSKMARMVSRILQAVENGGNLQIALGRYGNYNLVKTHSLKMQRPVALITVHLRLAPAVLELQVGLNFAVKNGSGAECDASPRILVGSDDQYLLTFARPSR